MVQKPERFRIIFSIEKKKEKELYLTETVLPFFHLYNLKINSSVHPAIAGNYRHIPKPNSGRARPD